MTWTAVGPLNTARQSFALVTAPAPSPASGLVLYALGGDAGVTATTAIGMVETFAPASGVWTPNVTTLPGTPLTGLAAATLNGQVHVIGGTPFGPTPSGRTTHNIFTPATNTWAPAGTPTALNTGRAFHAAVTGSDGCIYAIGGVDATNSPLGSVERYDPATQTWHSEQSMPLGARSGLAACVVGDNIYAIGGQSGAGAALTTVEVFSTVSRVWSTGTLAALSPGRAKLAVCVGPAGLIYAIGGLDSSGAPVNDVHSWDRSASAWLSVSPAYPATTGRLAAALGPDGRLYVAGGNTTQADNAVTGTTEVFTTSAAQPQPYIGNGTYQSPDIILTDLATNTPVPLGGQPNGPWDTQLTANTHYGLSAHIRNDTGVTASGTIVRFWSFQGGVGSAGTLLSEVPADIPPGGTPMSSPVQSLVNFPTGPAGTHQCAVVSLSDAAAPFINVDATTAAQVPDPTIPHPGGTSHYASAWRNTDSMGVGPGHIWHLPFIAATWVREPLPVHVNVTTAKVPLRFEETGEAAKLHEELQFMGAQPHLPLFLAPRVRSGLKPAPELEISVSSRQEKEEFVRLAEDERHELRTSHERPAAFTVRGRIPDDAQVGEAFLVDVGAHYPEGEGRPARTIRWLEVLYVIDVRRRPEKGYDD